MAFSGRSLKIAWSVPSGEQARSQYCALPCSESLTNGLNLPSAPLVLSAGSGGHFLANGAINGRAAQFVVDTGATFVSMGAADAQRFGVDWKAGQVGSAQTANGVMPAWRVKLASVRIGDVEVFDVDALVSQQPIPSILLGNSFLNRFQMKRDHEQMVLERRY